MAEIAFEQLSAALEATRGTAVTPPTHRFNMAGTLTPMMEIYRPPDEVGTLAEFQRSEVIRKWAEFEAEGALDTWALRVWLNMVMQPLTTGTQQGATTAYLWEFERSMTTDDIESATLYWGDPNQALLKAAFGMVQEFGWEADASGTDGATMSISGIAQFPTQLTGGSIPALPAIAVSPLLVPSKMQVWMDTSSAIGTTALTGRVISASGTVPTGVVPKYLATGPAGGITYERVGRQKVHPEVTVAFDLVDQTQYTVFETGDPVKLRVRINGDLIEGAHYNYFEHDIYGLLSDVSWGDLEGTNRTIEFTVQGEYDSTLGSDTRIALMSTKTNMS